jgi:TPR repeat protein
MANTTNIIPDKLTMYQRVDGGVWHYRVKLKTGKWYRLAAQQETVPAQVNLGVMYYQGDGVPENYLTAYFWLSVSAAQGAQTAKDNIEIIKNKLTNEQVAQGQTLAATCFDSNFKDCP